MDYMSWFYIESKFFELSAPEGGSVLRLVERRHGVSFWLLKLLILRLLGSICKML
jgi:hypothetical protein